MTPLSLEQVRRAVDGRTVGALPSMSIATVCTDGRQKSPQSLFVALRGENFDGHAFIPQAAASGAVAALVDCMPAQPDERIQYIQVADTRRALGRLAQYVRSQFTGKVIAVAGSNGKTGTKNLIDAALNTTLRGSISPKSFNNDIGVPFTIFAADPSHDYVVLELGTNHHGEIAWLTEISRPDIAVITNCHAEHLEGLTDLAGVRRENASIIAGIWPSGLLVVNGDDAELLAAVSGFRGERVTFGFNAGNDLRATDIRCTADGVNFRVNGLSPSPGTPGEGRGEGLRLIQGAFENKKDPSPYPSPGVPGEGTRAEFFIPLLGRHIAGNALAAIAVGRRMGVSTDYIIEGLSAATGPAMRLQLKEVNGISILNDAYNANPASMEAALQTMCDLSVNGRRIAILGDMREMGGWTEQFHRDIGRLAAKSNLDALVCVGTAAAWIAEAAQDAGMRDDVISHYPDAISAANAVKTWISSGDLVLLKGSRAIGLEKIAAIIEDGGEQKMLVAG
jgi:UDP-N-acetylmuramoyl-tripeptide--D-alanyl-D-alanine ligase